MEPIEPFVETSFPTSKRERRKVTKKGADKVHFASVLETTSGDSSSVASGFSSLADTDEDLEELLDSVHEIGEKLKENATLTIVQDYKQAVREFVSYIVKKTLSVEQHESGPNVLKRKRFTLVKVIDQKLDRLAAGIIQNQRSQLEILRQIDEISGMLIDLLS
jgi:hypothetical protein